MGQLELQQPGDYEGTNPKMKLNTLKLSKDGETEKWYLMTSSNFLFN